VEEPLVSIITPTYGRQTFLPAIEACVRSQTYQSIEWLILDDSDRPLKEFAEHPWNKIRYLHSSERLSVGEKRNMLLNEASGEIIIHFDDDDFYGSEYITNAVEFIEKKELDLALLSGFFVAHLNVNGFGYYRTFIKKGPGFAFNKNGVRPVDLGKLNIPLIHFCYGWSYVYRKKVWDNIKFKQISIFEDREFICSAIQKFKSRSHESRSVDCVHVIHDRSSSQCFPQFMIPDFVFESLSAKAYQHISRLKSVLADLERGQIAL